MRFKFLKRFLPIAMAATVVMSSQASVMAMAEEMAIETEDHDHDHEEELFDEAIAMTELANEADLPDSGGEDFVAPQFVITEFSELPKLEKDYFVQTATIKDLKLPEKLGVKCYQFGTEEKKLLTNELPVSEWEFALSPSNADEDPDYNSVEDDTVFYLGKYLFRPVFSPTMADVEEGVDTPFYTISGLESEPETEPTTETPATEPTTEAPATEPTTETPATEPTTETPATEPTTETPAPAVGTVTISLPEQLYVGQQYRVTYTTDRNDIPTGLAPVYRLSVSNDCVSLDNTGLLTVKAVGHFTLIVTLSDGVTEYATGMIDRSTMASQETEHTHTWVEATCTAPRTCSTCGATEGAALGHLWQDATCTTAKTCLRCGATEGSALGHSWKDATCTTPKICDRCGETEGEALGHLWKDATCTKPRTCSRCGETDGEALGHTWEDATCTKPRTCSTCGATEGKALGHDWQEATCTEPATCTVCGATKGKAAGHKWEKATCTTPKTCSVCGETQGTALGHTWKDATCTTPRTCSRCGETDPNYPATGHTWTEATCTKPATCSVCGATQGEAKGHTWTEATCTKPATCSVCGATQGEAKGHTWGEWQIVTQPTATTTGLKQRTCTVCGETATETIAALNNGGTNGGINNGSGAVTTSGNTITGIVSTVTYATNTNITFTANGAGMDNTSPVMGAVRYLPSDWAIGSSQNSFSSAPYSATFRISGAGTFTLRVNFQKQTFDGSAWISSGEWDTKEIQFAVADPGNNEIINGNQIANSTGTGNSDGNTAVPASTSETNENGEAIVTTNVKTGDNTNIAVYGALGVIALGAIIYLLVQAFKQKKNKESK